MAVLQPLLRTEHKTSNFFFLCCVTSYGWVLCFPWRCMDRQRRCNGAPSAALSCGHQLYPWHWAHQLGATLPRCSAACGSTRHTTAKHAATRGSFRGWRPHRGALLLSAEKLGRRTEQLDSAPPKALCALAGSPSLALLAAADTMCRPVVLLRRCSALGTLPCVAHCTSCYGGCQE